ncbi:hypothetical protein ACWDYK_12080 [Streptomyces anthocyanicus]|uniref:hypothetical protein n=1 Tax=Streptomyces anthocyanicus TaxID=68174 RepID=UPI002F9151DA|nr:hypothetical protein OHA15_41570 [Streptomyces anthocyanicus]
MHPWYVQLVRLVRSREGLGAILIFAGSAAAFGVVPNIVEKTLESGWGHVVVFLLFFVAMTAVVTVGWILRRERGVGVVIGLFPQQNLQDTRFRTMAAASNKNHSSTLVIEPKVLRPDGEDLPTPARIDLVANLIDARAEEYRASSGDGAVILYPLAPIHDGFLLGRRLAADAHQSLSVMHYSRADEETVVEGVTLGNRLRNSLDLAQRAAIAPYLTEPPGSTPRIVEHPGCPPEHRHRLALIVRVADAPSMLDDARSVAATGRVRRPTNDTHTGYIFDPEDFEAGGPPCGAHVVLDTVRGDLPDTPEIFQAMATHIYETWLNACAAWKTQSGADHVEGQLFMNPPLPIAMAVGWLMRHADVSVVHHLPRLLNKPPVRVRS